MRTVLIPHPSSLIPDMDESTLIQEKLREYLTLIGPLDRAGDEIELSRKMIRARTEDELHQIAPALGALSEVLGISSIDLLLAKDRRAFMQAAVERYRYGKIIPPVNATTTSMTQAQASAAAASANTATNQTTTQAAPAAPVK